MLFSLKTGTKVDRPHEQLVQYPMSLSDTDGNPLTGKKSYFTKCAETRYQKSDPPIITQSLPTGWKPKCSLLEGMFIINTTPLLHHKTLGDYGAFLLKRFVLPQFRNEVHVIFDSPANNQSTLREKGETQFLLLQLATNAYLSKMNQSSLYTKGGEKMYSTAGIARESLWLLLGSISCTTQATNSERTKVFTWLGHLVEI